jgi:hypothetical protein
MTDRDTELTPHDVWVCAMINTIYWLIQQETVDDLSRAREYYDVLYKEFHTVGTRRSELPSGMLSFHLNQIDDMIQERLWSPLHP